MTHNIGVVVTDKFLIDYTRSMKIAFRYKCVPYLTQSVKIYIEYSFYVDFPMHAIRGFATSIQKIFVRVYV